MEVKSPLQQALLRHRERSKTRFELVLETLRQAPCAEAAQAFADFRRQIEHHMTAEETFMFPEIERILGSDKGPTAAMRTEHRRFREMLAYIAACLDAEDRSGAAFAVERLAEQLEGHDMREEWVLLPMAERMFAGDSMSALAEALDDAA